MKAGHVTSGLTLCSAIMFMIPTGIKDCPQSRSVENKGAPQPPFRASVLLYTGLVDPKLHLPIRGLLEQISGRYPAPSPGIVQVDGLSLA